MATTKMTNAKALEIAIAELTTMDFTAKDEVIEKLNNQLVSLNKKSATPSKKSKENAEANASLAEMVLDFLRENAEGAFTVTELMKSMSDLPEDITNQKLTYILRMDSVVPFIEKSTEKGKTKYGYKLEG